MTARELAVHSAHVKVELLSAGVYYDRDFLDAYGADDTVIEKRRAYGNSDGVQFPPELKVPPEAILSGGIVAAINYRRDSLWRLRVSDTGYEISGSGRRVPVTFPTRPSFYDRRLADGIRASQIVTLYGDATLAIFSPGFCHYFNEDLACRFCSLKTTRETQSDHKFYIPPDLARQAVELALEMEAIRIRHVLVNGGTLKNYDKGFARHIDLLSAVAKVKLPPGARSHLISMPPEDLALFERLPETGANIVMCLEVYDPELFSQICPGKASGYGRDRMLRAFEAAVSVLGRGEVYGGFIAGLEPPESLIDGLYRMAEIGVAPAVNVFHSDAGTPLECHPRPKVDQLLEIGRHMGIIFRENGWVPFIRDTGRNSLDTEAFLRCFD
ncbi:MAG: radical SAM protein [Anaerolineales bacterium]